MARWLCGNLLHRSLEMSFLLPRQCSCFAQECRRSMGSLGCLGHQSKREKNRKPEEKEQSKQREIVVMQNNIIIFVNITALVYCYFCTAKHLCRWFSAPNTASNPLPRSHSCFCSAVTRSQDARNGRPKQIRSCGIVGSPLVYYVFRCC